MDARKIAEYTKRGKFVVWIDDKISAELTPEYMEEHTIAIVESEEYARELCARLHEIERRKFGRAATRYRISTVGEDYACSEELEPEKITDMINAMPLSPEDRERIIRRVISP